MLSMAAQMTLLRREANLTKAPKRQTDEDAQINAQENEGGPTPPAERVTELTRSTVQDPTPPLPKSKTKRERVDSPLVDP
jgi:hypothetical protein